MPLYRAIRNALGSCYLGDTKLAKQIPFSSVQTFDSRLVSFLQGLGQAVDVPAADAVSGHNIHDTLYALGFTQSDRNARLQAFYNELRYSIEMRQKASQTNLDLNRNGTNVYLGGPAGVTDLLTLAPNSYFNLTAATADRTSPDEIIVDDAGFTFSSPIHVKHEVGDTKVLASQPIVTPEQKTYANSVPVPNGIQSTFYPDAVNPFLLTWSRSLSRIRVLGSGTTPIAISLELPRPRNRDYYPSAAPVLPALHCLDELILRIEFSSDVVPRSDLRLLVTTGNVEASVFIGDISSYGVLFSSYAGISAGSALVLRARTPAVADDYVHPPASLPAWRVDAWFE